MSANLALVRSIYAAWERGDYSSTEWADPDIEYAILGGLGSANVRGRAEMREAVRANIGIWAHLRSAAEEYRELDAERVLVLDDLSGRGKRSGLQFAQGSAHLFHVGDGKVTRLVTYWDRDRAFADLGLTPEE